MRKIDLDNFHVASSETARHINRRIVLNLIRKHQPISRAGVAVHSGLQRSTVSAIAEQLISERWIREGATGQTLRGRRPTFLHINMERAAVMGVDVRPVTTTFAVARLDTQFRSQESMATGNNPEKYVSRLCERLSYHIKSHPEIAFEGIGVSLPGRVDLESNKLVFAPNLGWTGLDLKTPLEKATGLSVELENAANACALAELWYGREAEGVRNLIVVTVSEGVGVGMILNGQLVHGARGMAGEFGHVTVAEDGPLCRCGNHGCWEMVASNQAAVRHYIHNGALRPAPRSRHGNGVTLTFSDLIQLVERGDRQATSALEYMARNLGAGIAMLIAGMAPDRLVVVGEVTRVWNRVGPIINKLVEQRVHTGAATIIRPTEPMDQPRLRGTVALVLQKHFGAPFIA